jgi:hypothetical protein
MSSENAPPASDRLIAAFRTHYRRYEGAVQDALSRETDAVVLARLGDDLDEYSAMVTKVCVIRQY